MTKRSRTPADVERIQREVRAAMEKPRGEPAFGSPIGFRKTMSEIDYSGLPASLRAGMRRYLEQHIETGSFLRAVIEDNRSEAFRRADPENQARLQEIWDWAARHIPAEGRGVENRWKWIEGGKSDSYQLMAATCPVVVAAFTEATSVLRCVCAVCCAVMKSVNTCWTCAAVWLTKAQVLLTSVQIGVVQPPDKPGSSEALTAAIRYESEVGSTA